MSKIEVNAIEPQCGTTLTVGAAGTTVAVPSNVVKSNALQASDAGNIISQSGTTITLGATGDSINLASGATQTGFGRTGTVDWQTGSIKTGTFTAVNGEGYFVDTSSGISTANLPAGVAGAIVSFADYTRTFQTNSLTIVPNGSEKVGGVAANFVAETEGQSITLVYVDATEGWINTTESTGQAGVLTAFITATGGTITTVCTDYKVHTFTGPGTFTVCSAGNPLGSATVDYMVVAGGGGGGSGNPGSGEGGGGGGAGGFRESSGTASGSYSASPLGACVSALPVAATGYPIVVGGGGPGECSGNCGVSPTRSGSNSSFSTITSAGGGGGGTRSFTTPIDVAQGASGGSGGGGAYAGPTSSGAPGGTGNTPSVSPAQGFKGGDRGTPGSPNIGCGAGGGGGGATVAGTNAGTNIGGPGGNGATTSINATPTARAGGGGGGGGTTQGTGGSGGGGTGANPSVATAGTTNTGGGGGGGFSGNDSQAGGSGIVIIRYKFQ
jgi:hypothetical protein